MLTIYIDADACPVKDEVYRVADRYDLAVIVVSNKMMRMPNRHRQVVVPDNIDAADDWIAARAATGDVVVTADIPLASRCLRTGARVLGFKGREFSEASIGDALATRELLEQLRQMGENTGGPAPLVKKDRSRFLSRLDEIVNAIRRERG